MLNVEAIKQLAAQAYISHAQDAFGIVGEKLIVKLLDNVKLIYDRCPPENISGTLTVIIGVDTTPLAPQLKSLGDPRKLSSYEDIGKVLIESDEHTHSIVEITTDGSFHFLNSITDYDLFNLAQNSLVYRYEKSTDQILAKNHHDFLPKVSPLLLSNFASPTLSNLESCLEYYAIHMAAESQCRILAKIWEGGVNGPRLVLVNRPESLMRDSLIQSLQLLLRDTNVRPEHNSDETKPVDIKVEWFGSAASALIEVKWLGKSTSKSQDSTDTSIKYLEYYPSRAQDGANQLADYLDRETRHSHLTKARGYLVIFDARRKNIKGKDDKLLKEDALHYEHSHLSFFPDHAKIRSDFSDPYRFFLKPRESNFLNC